MLFLGSFRHTPNQVALNWFVTQVLPQVLAGVPEARLMVVGADLRRGIAFPILALPSSCAALWRTYMSRSAGMRYLCARS